MPDPTHYTYRVTWSAEDGEHVAAVAVFNAHDLPELHLDPGVRYAEHRAHQHQLGLTLWQSFWTAPDAG